MSLSTRIASAVNSPEFIVGGEHIVWFIVAALSVLFLVSLGREFRRGDEAGTITERFAGGIQNMVVATTSLWTHIVGFVLVVAFIFGVTDGALIWSGGLLVGLDPVAWAALALGVIGGAGWLGFYQPTIEMAVLWVIFVASLVAIVNVVVNRFLYGE